ncbi:DUF6252 family protein [Fulvivirgaceae bacterium BMA12]|uniref:DUF6252 family protein n=1 Tax=Agaribacillus aureus TaxID=3051825 RepID=A0ABT8LDI6_9BACT|nr:DUF6252 family protein [Fulvivirgaceae bacterium BMA12]
MINFFLRSTGMWIIALVLFTACGSDDDTGLIPDDDVAPGTPGSITCKINGQTYAATFPFVTGALSTTNDIYSFALGGVDFLGKDTVSIAMAMTGTDLSRLSAGDTFSGTGNIFINFALGTVIVKNRPAVDEDASSSETDVATITVTKIDRDNELISGTFSYEAFDDDTQNTFKVTDGVFADIKYD